jgi:arylsulfatase A-like enzyme
VAIGKSGLESVEGPRVRTASLVPFAAAALLASCSRSAADRPDIVLIVVDTLRADHVGCYGYPRATTPNVDGLAGVSIRYETGLASAPWTGTSIATLFTGLYGSSHGLLTCSAPLGGDVLPGDFLAPGNVTLAESLSAAGYRTAAIASNPWLRARFGYSQGFDTFDELPAKAAAAQVTDRAISRYEEERGAGSGPLFLYVHYMDAHGPYRPDPPFDTLFRSTEERHLSDEEWAAVEPYLRQDQNRNLADYVDSYDGGIRQCDEQIGRLLRSIGTRLSGTVVVFTADHGEEFFEHGRAGHGYSLFEEMVRVPFLLHVPGQASRVVAAPEFAGLVDVAPTLLALAGADACGDRFDGRDLLAGGLAPDAAWAENHTKGIRLVSRRRADSKALFSLDDSSLSAWFDLAMDPREAKNLLSFLPTSVAAKERSSLGEFARGCHRRRTRVTAGFVPPGEPVDVADAADLEKLGYVK